MALEHERAPAAARQQVPAALEYTERGALGSWWPLCHSQQWDAVVSLADPYKRFKSRAVVTWFGHHPQEQSC